MIPRVPSFARPSRFVEASCGLLLACTLVLASAGPAAGQNEGIAFDMKLGYSSIGSEWGDALSDGADAELNFYYQLSKLRLGWGIDLASYGLVEPTEKAETASQVGMQFSVAYPFRRGKLLDPYVEGRLTWDRFGVEGEVEGFPPPDEDGENTTPRVKGWGGTAVVGVLVRITDQLSADFSGRYGYFRTDVTELDYVDQPTVATGTRWGLRTGLVWYW